MLPTEAEKITKNFVATKDMFLDMVACAKEGKFEMPPYVDVLQVGLQLPFLHLKAVGKIVGKVILY